MKQCSAQGVASEVPQQRRAAWPRFARSQQWGALSYGCPIALFAESRYSLCAGEKVQPLRLREGQGRKALVQASYPFPPHLDHRPMTAHRRPGTQGSSPDAQPQNARETLTISPSSSPHHCACAARVPAEPLQGSLFDSSYPGTPAPPFAGLRLPKHQALTGRPREVILGAGVAFYLQDIRRG